MRNPVSFVLRNAADAVKLALLDICPHCKVRAVILKRLGAKIGKNVCVDKVLLNNFRGNVANLDLGDNVYIGSGTILDLTAPITIGKSSAISPGCILTTHQDCGSFGNSKLLAHFPPRREPIVIGEMTWIGAGTNILCGVTIGSNVVIGASSLVNKDIPDYSVAYGIPAKVMRKIGIGINSQSPAGNAIRGLCPAGSR